MNKTLSLIVAIFLVNISFGQSKVSIDSLIGRIGEKVEICSKVHGIKAFERVTFINLGAAYPNSPLTVVIFGKDYPNFKDLPSSLYLNKQICVTGTLA